MSSTGESGNALVLGVSGAETSVLARALAQHTQLELVGSELLEEALGTPEGFVALDALVRDRTRLAGKSSWVLDAGASLARLSDFADASRAATVVVLVRDAREVVVEAGTEQLKLKALRDRARRWLAEIEQVFEYEARAPDRIVRTAYEDLIVTPEEELARIWRSCGLDPDLLGPPPEALVELLGGSNARWPQRLTAKQVEAVEAIVQPTLTLLGYPPLDPRLEFAPVRRRAAEPAPSGATAVVESPARPTGQPAPSAGRQRRPARVPPNSNSAFRDLVEWTGDRPRRILDIGAGGFAGQTTTVHLLDLFPDAHVTAVEIVPASAEKLREQLGDRIEIVVADIADFVAPEPYDLVVIDLHVSGIPFEFDVLLDAVLVPYTRRGGLIILNVVMDVFNTYHGRQAIRVPDDAPAVTQFMLRRFGHLVLTEARIRAAYADHPELEAIAAVEKWRGDPSNLVGWAAFRCRTLPGRFERAVADRTSSFPARREAERALPVEDGDYVAFDLIGDTATCGEDCRELVATWSELFRTRFGELLDPPELVAGTRRDDWSPAPEAEAILPSDPLAILEIPGSIDEYMELIGAKPRNMVRKAHRKGFRYETFSFNDRLDEIFAINTSKPTRASGPLASHLQRPPNPVPERDLCDEHRVTHFGAFREGVLLAYIELHELHDLAIFNRFLGHADALPDGVMNGLVHHVVEQRVGSDVVALSYGTFEGEPSLKRFKQSVGFRPRAAVLRVLASRSG